MRRKDREVTNSQEIVEIMSRCQVLHLAFSSENAPYLLPLSFGMEPDGMTLYVHGAKEGMKYRLLEKDPRVGFEMDCTNGLVLDDEDHSCTVRYESVMGWGILEEITHEDEKIAALDCIMRHYHAENFAYSHAPIARTRILRLKIQERSCKRREKRG